MGRMGNLPTISVVVDGRIDNVFASHTKGILKKVLYCGPEAHDVQPISRGAFVEICDVARWESEPLGLANLGAVSARRNASLSRLAEIVKQRGHKEKEISAIMLEQRLRLVFLLQTPGGCMHVERLLEKYAARVRKNGGEVWAFGRESVQSAGALLFMAADPSRRYLEHDSQLFFHLSTLARKHHSHQHSLADMYQKRADEIASLKDLLVRNSVHRDYAAYIKEGVVSVDKKTPIGEDATWTFNDKEAEQLWNVRRHRRKHLRYLYEEQLGEVTQVRNLLKESVASPIRRFFR